MTATRPWPSPPRSGTTLHLIGDMHYGARWFLDGKIDKLGRDLHQGLVEHVDAVVQTGDATNQQGTAVNARQDTLIREWATTYIDADVPLHWVCGNHDIWHGVRDPQQWADDYGLPSPNYVADVGFARLIAVSPRNGTDPAITLSSEMVSWLDRQLSETTRPCLIACHAPLPEVVSGVGADFWTNTEAGSAASDLLEVLDAHDNALAWLSGHTHTDPAARGVTAQTSVGSRTIADINDSSLYGVAGSDQYQTINDPIRSVFVTLMDDGKTIEARWRDHGAGLWWAPHNNTKVISLGNPHPLAWGSGRWGVDTWGASA